MRKFKFLSMAAIAAMMLGACSDDKISDGPDSPNGPVDNTEGVYMTVNIQMPSTGTSRSFTDDENSSNDGIEIGKDYENNVSNIYLVLAKKDYTFIDFAEVTTGITELNGPTNKTYTTTAKFTKTTIEEYYNKPGFDPEISVFVFCNPIEDLRTVLENAKKAATKNNNWVNETCQVFEGNNNNQNTSIWGKNSDNAGSFLMSNAEIATRSLPAKKEDWEYYKTENSAFNLSGWNNQGQSNQVDNLTKRGPIKVERSVARFDFKDGSPEFKGKNSTNTYQVVFASTDDGENGTAEVCYVNIKLTKMGLVNMNNKFYYLRRVSENGTSTNTTLCGSELPWYSDANGTIIGGSGNYVVDAYAKEKADPIKSNYASYFNFPFFNEEGKVDNPDGSRWSVTSIDDVLGKESDNWKDKEYHIWRYATENTIPAPSENQINGQSTGVVFKGKMIATEAALNSDDPRAKELAEIINGSYNGTPITGDPDKDPILYLFSGSLYATWPNVREAAIKESMLEPKYNEAEKKWEVDFNRSNPLYLAAFKNGGVGQFTINVKVDHYDSDGNLESTTTETETIVDSKAIDPESADAIWTAWDKTGRTDDNLKSKMKTAMTDAKFTLYQSSIDNDAKNGGPGYYCYYYYWNRHNDNGNNGVMGPMEFSVVRNNVYKLAVTKINRLGHPRIVENDPNRPDKDTKDETDDVYMTVSVEVLPWVVRVNNIEF